MWRSPSEIGEAQLRSFKVTLHETIRNDDLFLAQHSVAALLQHCFEWLQHCSNIVALFCAKNRRCESSRVTWSATQSFLESSRKREGALRDDTKSCVADYV